MNELIQERRGFKNVRDEKQYKSFGGYFFESEEKENFYNQSIKYNFLEESKRLLKEFREYDKIIRSGSK